MLAHLATPCQAHCVRSGTWVRCVHGRAGCAVRVPLAAPMCGEEFVAFCGSELAQISNVIFRTFDLGYQFISGAFESILIRRFEKRAGRPGRRCDDGLLARLPAIAVNSPTHFSWARPAVRPWRPAAAQLWAESRPMNSCEDLTFCSFGRYFGSRTRRGGMCGYRGPGLAVPSK